MTSYRITKENNKFYPEYRWLFFWWRWIGVGEDNIQFNQKPLYFDALEAAKLFIEKEKGKRKSVQWEE